MASAEDALLRWVQSFNHISGATDSWGSLEDGVALFQICADFAPDYFDLRLLKQNAASNELLRLSNVRRVVDGLLDYYDQEMRYRDVTTELDIPDPEQIVGRQNHAQLVQLVRLILGAAVFGPEREDNIARILSLEPAVQAQLAMITQELMDIHHSLAQAADEGAELSHSTRSDSIDEKGSEVYEQRMKTTALEEENLRLRDEAEDLRAQMQKMATENEALQAQVKHFRSEEQGPGQSLLKEEGRRLQQALDLREEEAMQYKQEVDGLQTEIQNLKRALESAEEEAAQARRYQDERDSLKHNEERVRRLENALQLYQRQVEELPELKERLRLAEEANAMYIEEKFELEERLRILKAHKMGDADTALGGAGGGGTHDLHEVMEALEAARGEAEDARNKLGALEREKQSLLDELNGYKNRVDELEFDLQRTGASGGGGLPDAGASLAAEMSGDKGIVAKLERELALLRKRNERLTHQATEADKRVSDLLSGGAAGASVAASELSALQEKLLNAQMQLTEVTEKYNKMLTEGPGGGSASEKEYLQQINKLLSEVGTLSGANTQWERDVKFLTDELNAVREKYDHASKALSKIQSGGREAHMLALQNELLEKDSQISQLKMHQAQMQARFQHEQRLITTAWYNMSVRLQEISIFDHLPGARTATGTATSWMTQQRKSSSARFSTRVFKQPLAPSPQPQQI